MFSKLNWVLMLLPVGAVSLVLAKRRVALLIHASNRCLPFESIASLDFVIPENFPHFGYPVLICLLYANNRTVSTRATKHTAHHPCYHFWGLGWLHLRPILPWLIIIPVIMVGVFLLPYAFL